MAVLTAGAIPIALFSPVGRRAVAGAAVAYGSLIVLALRKARPSEHDADPVTFALALPVMHAAWGWGTLRGLLRLLSPRRSVG
jgi:hypothetical protein